MTWISRVLNVKSAVSAKKLAGLFGWFVCTGLLVYAVSIQIKLGVEYELFLIVSAALIGLDSIAEIIEKFTPSKLHEINEKLDEFDKECDDEPEDDDNDEF